MDPLNQPAASDVVESSSMRLSPEPPPAQDYLDSIDRPHAGRPALLPGGARPASNRVAMHDSIVSAPLEPPQLDATPPAETHLSPHSTPLPAKGAKFSSHGLAPEPATSLSNAVEEDPTTGKLHCPLPGCDKLYQHKESLKRHLVQRPEGVACPLGCGTLLSRGDASYIEKHVQQACARGPKGERVRSRKRKAEDGPDVSEADGSGTEDHEAEDLLSEEHDTAGKVIRVGATAQDLLDAYNQKTDRHVQILQTVARSPSGTALAKTRRLSRG